MNPPLLSIVTPAFQEAPNLPILYRRLQAALHSLDWEWLVIDDHSSDDTFAAASAFAQADPRVRALRLSRNFGSHAAIACGLEHARGRAVALLAADLQDAPEALLPLLERWYAGAQVVWAVPHHAAFSSRLFYRLLRRAIPCPQMPLTGTRFFLIDRIVADAVRQFAEAHTNLFALIAWMGFRQAYVPCERRARGHGRSSWTLSRKIDLAAGSLLAFSHAPLRFFSALGAATVLLGFLYAAFVLVRAVQGVPVPGWPSLLVAVLVLSGTQMLMIGILGEYLWRTLREARRRPRYLIEQATAPLTGEVRLPS